MTFQITNISVILFVSVLVNLFVGLISWRKRKGQGGFYFSLGVFALTFWTFFAGLDYAATTIPAKVFFAKIEAVGYNFALLFFLFFALHYSRYENHLDIGYLKPLLYFLPLSNIFLVFTNDLHGWVWSGFSWSQYGQNIAIFHHGPGFWWLVGTGYLQMFFILLTLWSVYRRSVGLVRKQARLLLGAALLPFSGEILYLFQIEGIAGIDWSPLMLTGSSVIFIFALYGMSFLDIAPIARDVLLSKLQDGLVVMNAEKEIVEVNQHMADILGKRSSELLGEALENVLPNLRQYLVRPDLNDMQGELTLHSDQKRYFEFFLTPLLRKSGENLGYLLVLRDITERKKTEISLRQRTAIVEQSPMTVVVTDIDGFITYVNPQFAKLTGFAEEEALGQQMSIVRSEFTPLSTYKDMWTAILAGKVWRGEILNKKKNGELYWEWSIISPVYDEDGEKVSFIAVKENITERKQAQEALKKANERLETQLVEIKKLQTDLREQAIRDPLTQLYNRRFLVDVLEREFATAERRKNSLSIIILDIDYFKAVNDTYGHHIGDECLVAIADLLRDSFRDADIVCRFGGEEFLVVLPDSAPEFAQQRAEDFRKLVEETHFSFGENEVALTISLGIASYPAYGTVADEIIQKADQALYDAKNQGRNRVVLYGS